MKEFFFKRRKRARDQWNKESIRRDNGKSQKKRTKQIPWKYKVPQIK
jgi:hypothetical protein